LPGIDFMNSLVPYIFLRRCSLILRILKATTLYPGGIRSHDP
jgi:hypothetical protein